MSGLLGLETDVVYQVCPVDPVCTYPLILKPLCFDSSWDLVDVIQYLSQLRMILFLLNFFNPAPVSLAIPVPVSLAIPAPVSLTIPAPVSLAIPAPVSLAIPAPVSD